MVPVLSIFSDVIKLGEKVFATKRATERFKNLCSLVALELKANYEILYHQQEDTYPLRTNDWKKTFDFLSQHLKKGLFIALTKVYYRIETFTSDRTNNLNREEIIRAIKYCEKNLNKLSHTKET